MLCVEPRQNIAVTRQHGHPRSVDGEFVAFIDDDEFPIRQWLLTFFTSVQGSTRGWRFGPVKPHFDLEPPRWVRTGGFYDRPSYPTGMVIDGKRGPDFEIVLIEEICF